MGFICVDQKVGRDVLRGRNMDRNGNIGEGRNYRYNSIQEAEKCIENISKEGIHGYKRGDLLIIVSHDSRSGKNFYVKGWASPPGKRRCCKWSLDMIDEESYEVEGCNIYYYLII